MPALKSVPGVSHYQISVLQLSPVDILLLHIYI